MKAAVLVFPGSNCDRDMAVALRRVGAHVTMVWHKDAEIGDVDLVAVPGGFSFGDYLRCGAIAANSPVSQALKRHVKRGGYALGVCNGFQVLTETGLLPGALMRNAALKFVCKSVAVAHHDGNYTADDAVLDMLRDQDRIAFTYADNFNGSRNAIAGVLSENRRVLGMMPHPERAVDAATGNTDGLALFRGLVQQLADA
jgi:phosphoribosylformylglycinamidine (FGAM) synthase-like amidotransferase family enzyme